MTSRGPSNAKCQKRSVCHYHCKRSGTVGWTEVLGCGTLGIMGSASTYVCLGGQAVIDLLCNGTSEYLAAKDESAALHNDESAVQEPLVAHLLYGQVRGPFRAAAGGGECQCAMVMQQNRPQDELRACSVADWAALGRDAFGSVCMHVLSQG